MSSLDTIQAVADKLAALGYKATNEYPGAVHVLTDVGLFVAGDINPTWGMDYYRNPDDASVPDESVNLDVASDSTDADKIAARIDYMIQMGSYAR